MAKIQLGNESVKFFENIFVPGQTRGACLVKIKVIQEMIQVERPRNWDMDKLKNVVSELMKIELYNAKKNRTVDKFEIKWKSYENLT